MLPRSVRSTVIFKVSALNSTGHTGNELLLHEEENRCSRNGCQHNSTHHHTIVRGIGSAHCRQDQRQSALTARLQCNQRPQIAVPNVHESNNNGSSIGGLHGRHINLQENLNLAKAVNTCSLNQILGEGCCILLEEEDQEGSCDAGDNNGTGRIQTDGSQTKLDGIRSDSQWLVRMVENLLSVTRIDGPGPRLIKTETVLEELIDAVLIKFHKSYPQQEVTVSIPDEFVSIPMDAVLMQQVIVNLLENAVEHAYGMTWLELAVTTNHNRAEFSVRDDGCGISKERLENLFTGYLGESEGQGDSKRRNMGIGLSVCASIIKAHGSKMEVRNLPQGGVEFRFVLEMEENNGE